MPYRLSIKQQDPQDATSWIWEILDGDHPKWFKRSMNTFRSSGLATASGMVALKQLSALPANGSTPVVPRAVQRRRGFKTTIIAMVVRFRSMRSKLGRRALQETSTSQ